MSCGIGCRRGSDPTLLWLWHRPVATAPIQPHMEPGNLHMPREAAQEIAKKRQKKKKKVRPEVPVMAQQKRIQLGTTRLRVRSLASLNGLRIWRCCELWCRSAATAPIRPLAWEPPYGTGAAPKREKKTKKKKKVRLVTKITYILPFQRNITSILSNNLKPTLGFLLMETPGSKSKANISNMLL